MAKSLVSCFFLTHGVDGWSTGDNGQDLKVQRVSGNTLEFLLGYYIIF